MPGARPSNTYRSCFSVSRDDDVHPILFLVDTAASQFISAFADTKWTPYYIRCKFHTHARVRTWYRPSLYVSPYIIDTICCLRYLFFPFPFLPLLSECISRFCGSLHLLSSILIYLFFPSVSLPFPGCFRFVDLGHVYLMTKPRLESSGIRQCATIIQSNKQLNHQHRLPCRSRFVPYNYHPPSPALRLSVAISFNNTDGRRSVARTFVYRVCSRFPTFMSSYSPPPSPLIISLLNCCKTPHPLRKLGNQVNRFFSSLAFFCGKHDSGRVRSYYAERRISSLRKEDNRTTVRSV